MTQIVKSVETDRDGNEKTLYYYYGDNKLIAQEEYRKGEDKKKDTGSDTKDNTKGDASAMQAVAGTYLTYHFNNVGSTTAVTDKNGSIKYQYDYSPYGDLIKGNYGEVLFLYNGQYGVASDDNGLYYMRARYYNVDIKRFINQDVLTGSIDSSPSLNRYAYVEGNPVSYLDPFGLEKVNLDKIHFYLDCIAIVLNALAVSLVLVGNVALAVFAARLILIASRLIACAQFVTYLMQALYGTTREEKDEGIMGCGQTVVYFIFGESLGLIGRYWGGLIETITGAISSVISDLVYAEAYNANKKK